MQRHDCHHQVKETDATLPLSFLLHCANLLFQGQIHNGNCTCILRKYKALSSFNSLPFLRESQKLHLCGLQAHCCITLLMTWVMKTVLQWTNVSAYRRSYVMYTCLLSEVMHCMLLCVQFVLQVCQSVVDPRYLSGASDLERPVSSGVQTYGTQKEEWPLTKPMTKRDATYQVPLAHLFQNLFSPAGFFTGQSTCLEGVLKLAVLSCFVCVCAWMCLRVYVCVLTITVPI